MNIFVLSTDPTIAAQYHCNQHVSKMILEGTQMLCTALYMRGTFPYEGKRLGFYMPTHENHQCTQWVAEDISHAAWLMRLLHALDVERKYRGSRYTHSSLWIADDAFTFYNKNSSVDMYESYPQPTRWAEAITPEHIKNDQALDTVAKYQAYYAWKNKYQFHMHWNPRAIPSFINLAHSQNELPLS